MENKSSEEWTDAKILTILIKLIFPNESWIATF